MHKKSKPQTMQERKNDCVAGKSTVTHYKQKGVIAIVNPITTTFHKGTTVAQKHNRRDPKCVAKEKHIDPNGEYIVWIDEDVRKAYKRIFDEAVYEQLYRPY